ncbi:fungal-specific transcription factor domain-containing protein [Peziza echinospora]|nr:fungal-specific transcription factor domain-containing protein [Peziza echinospora]
MPEKVHHARTLSKAKAWDIGKLSPGHYAYDEDELVDIKPKPSPTMSKISRNKHSLPKISITSSPPQPASPTNLQTRAARAKTYSPPSISSRKRKAQPDTTSAPFTPAKKANTWPHSHPSTSVGKMNLDINDIGMPGRTGNTRSRTKVPSTERRRVPVACDSCRNRKIKCNGDSPCQNCVKNSYSCHFPPVSAKIVVEENWVVRLQGRCSALERCLMEAIPDAERREEVAAHYGLRLQQFSDSSPSDSGDCEPAFNTRSPLVAGHQAEESTYANFIGDSAGPTFMNKIREFMRATVPQQQNLGQSPYSLDPVQEFLSTDSSFSQRSANLSLPATNAYTLPHKATVVNLLGRFVSFLGCGSGVDGMTPSGGIYHWFDLDRLLKDIDLLYASADLDFLGIGAPSRRIDTSTLCLLNAVLALACQATSGGPIAGTLPIEEETMIADAYFWRYDGSRTSSGGRSLTPDQAYTPTSPHSTSDYGDFESQAPYYTVTDVDYNNPPPPAVLLPPPQTSLPGITFFARAKALINPSDAPSLLTLKTLSMLSYFCLSANRWEAAYLHIGLAVRLAVANGLHRSTASLVIVDKRREEEDRRRTFWTIYILDRLVSCLTGRPVMLSDDAIDTPLPENLDGLPSASGLIAHIQLSRIMGDIITNVYPIRTPGTAQTQHQTIAHAMQKCTLDLESWHENLAHEVRLVNGVARERGVLSILTNRPELLREIKRGTSTTTPPSTTTSPIISGDLFPHGTGGVQVSTNICINAAKRTINLARQIEASGWISSSSVTECGIVFDSAVVLVVGKLLPGVTSTGRGEYDEDVRYAAAFLDSMAKGGVESATGYLKELVGLEGAVERVMERSVRMGYEGVMHAQQGEELLREMENLEVPVGIQGYVGLFGQAGW